VEFGMALFQDKVRVDQEDVIFDPWIESLRRNGGVVTRGWPSLSCRMDTRQLAVGVVRWHWVETLTVGGD